MCFSLNDFNDSQQNPSRGVYGAGGASRGGGRQGTNRGPPDPDSQRTRMGFGRSTMQASSSSSQPARGGNPPGQEGAGGAAASQLPARKARSSKHPVVGVTELQAQGSTGSPLPQHRALCTDDPDYASLLGAMDNDMERPETPLPEASQELASQPTQNKGELTIELLPPPPRSQKLWPRWALERWGWKEGGERGSVCD